MKNFPSIKLVFLLSILCSSRCFDLLDDDSIRLTHQFDDDFDIWRKSFQNFGDPFSEGGGSDIGLVWPFSNEHHEPFSRETPELEYESNPQDSIGQQPGSPVVGLERDREPLEPDVEVLPTKYGNPEENKRHPVGGTYKPSASDPSTLFQHHFNTLFNAPESNFFSGAFPGFGFFDLNVNKPWWKGENVCVEREEQEEEPDGDDNHEIAVDGSNFHSFGVVNLNFESCAEKQNKHVCTSFKNHNGRKRTVKVTRQCCHGYARPRNGPSNAHCEKFDLYPIAETIERLGAKEFITTLKKGGLESLLNGDVTVFAVLDGAYTKFAEQMWENNLVAFDVAGRTRRQVDISGMTARDLILAHAVNGSYHIEDVSNEQLLKTELPNTNIRINIFPRGPSERNAEHPYRYTANCAPLVKLNREAEKGIVHVADRVLLPVRNSIMQIIRARDDMTVLRTILEGTGLDKTLEEAGDDKHYTFFAPNDDAFLKLDTDIRRKLKAGNGCATNILKNHILDITFCSLAALNGVKTSTYNLLSEKLEFERVSIGKSEVEDMSAEKKLQRIKINGIATIQETDLMGTNGVIHVIDTVLSTNSGMPVSNTLSSRNLTIFKQLIDDAGLEDEFDSMSNKTFFIPSDKAFEQSELGQYWIQQLKEYPGSLRDNARLKEFLKYHVGEPLTKTSDLQENMIKTATGEELRVNLYTTNPVFSNILNRATVNCARLMHFDDEACGSVVHEIDKVLEAPKSNVYDALKANPDYSMFVTLIHKGNLTGLLSTINETTIFVPKNDVFLEVKEWYDGILHNDEEADNVIRSHIVPSVICCAGIVQSDWPFIRTTETINQQRLKLNRNRRPQVQNAGVTKCDIVAKNGIIHEINDVISTEKRRPVEPQGFPSFTRPLTFWFK
ncbi:periostin isoform X1 [Wyeomyia smithii]|uniref:periostin isoform X1 n=1 Tax=Wyeomyia smithii TaxID=174621 RepID=UPI002467AC55|nr:periostin isoform X1 [Wyeomyia smithii]